MPDITSLLPQLGTAGLALFILWKVSESFIKQGERRDAAHAKEREDIRIEMKGERSEFRQRIDTRDDAFRALEKDIRENLATTLVETGNVLKQAVVYLARKNRS